MAGMVEVTEYKEYTPYALYTKQANINKNLFFAGSITGGKYLSTTDKDSKVARVFLEKDGEGWRIYTIVDGSKLYVEVVEGKAALNSEPQGNVWTINSEVNVPVTMVGDTEYYLGCYKTYDTFSASKTSYILNDTSVIGVSQFPMEALSPIKALDTYVIKAENEVKEGVEYSLVVEQNNIGKVLYFGGSLTGGKYLSTTTDFSKNVVVSAQMEGEGFRLVTKDNKYVEIVDGKAAFNDSPLGSVWVLDSETGIPMTDCGGTMYYLGCYKTYETFSASKTSYISDTSVIGVSQFPVVLSYVAE